MIKSQPKFKAGQSQQPPIIKPAPASQPIAFLIKSHARHQDQIHLSRRNLQSLRRRFQNPKFARGQFVRLNYFCRLIAPICVIARVAKTLSIPRQNKGIRFIRQGREEQHCAG